MVWKDEESIFQRRFHGRRCCRIIRSLLRRGRRRRMKNFAGTQPLSLGCLEQSVAYWPPANQRHSLSSPFGRRINADSLLKRKHGGFVSIFLTRDSLSPKLQGFVYFPFLVNFCVVRQNHSFSFSGETPELLFKMTFKSPFFKTCFRQTLHAHRWLCFQIHVKYSVLYIGKAPLTTVHFYQSHYFLSFLFFLLFFILFLRYYIQCKYVTARYVFLVYTCE